MILQLIHSQAARYPEHTAAERLLQVDLSPSQYSRLRRWTGERVARQSVIPEEDVAAVVGFIVEHPDVGAERARLTLIDREEALVSCAFINEAKQDVARLCEEHYQKRSEQEKLLEAGLRARRQSALPYEPVQATRPHHIWATDFVAVQIMAFKLVLCVVYDVYSQAYIAIEAGTACDHQLARRAIEGAIRNAGATPDMLRRDNGLAFVVQAIQDALAASAIQDAPIPPGKPWFNGSLESNNTSLKDAIKTDALLHLPECPDLFEDGRRSRDAAVAVLQQICDRVRTTLNDHIARPKFGMPPGRVLAGRFDDTRRRHADFVRRKTDERSSRMDQLRSTPDRPAAPKTFLEKVGQAFAKRLPHLTTDQLYALNEAIHRRYQAVET